MAGVRPPGEAAARWPAGSESIDTGRDLHTLPVQTQSWSLQVKRGSGASTDWDRDNGMASTTWER